MAGKNIVICSDGTGNSAVKGRGTNVFKLFEAVDLNGPRDRGPEECVQIAIYDDGIGTGALKPMRLLAGAFGLGLSRNVRQLYRELLRVYRPEDRIYLFGFSRGAFTVRTLVGLIDHCGIPDGSRFHEAEAVDGVVKEAYKAYRSRHAAFLQRFYRFRFTKRAREAYARERLERFRAKVREQMPEGQIHPDRMSEKVAIEFVGVWDTVAAVGLPIVGLSTLINKLIYRVSFDDLTLSPRVKRACHALSIDDERQSFRPVLWDERLETDDRIEQVWFPGVHSNVGGGYVKQGMSLVTLDWMMDRAAKSHGDGEGLKFIPEVKESIKHQRNEHDKLYDSRAGLAVYYRFQPRTISPPATEDELRAALPPDSGDDGPLHTRVLEEMAPRQEEKLRSVRIHASTFQRIALDTEGYAPGTLPREFKVVGWDSLDPEKTAAIESVVQEAMDDAGYASLLDVAPRSIGIRKTTYWIFIAASLLTLLFLLPNSAREPWGTLPTELRTLADYDLGAPLPEEVASIPSLWAQRLPATVASAVAVFAKDSFIGVIFDVLRSLVQRWWLGLLLIALYAVSWKAYRIRRDKLVVFWHPLRRKLLDTLG